MQEDIEDRIHAAVHDIQSGALTEFRGMVHDEGLMRELVHAYTAAELEHAADCLDRDMHFDTTPHYEELSALWGGGSAHAAFFSPMDVLSCPNGHDEATACVIWELPGQGVDWGPHETVSPLMFAITEQHGHQTLNALCKRGAFFSAEELPLDGIAALVTMPVPCMEAVLCAFDRDAARQDFVLRKFEFKPNVMGTALHVCCTVTAVEAIFETMCSLMLFGVNARAEAATHLRAADILAGRAAMLMAGSAERRVLCECVRHLARMGAGPMRFQMREFDKLAGARLPAELAERIYAEAF